MDISEVVSLLKESSFSVLGIIFLTTLFNLVINKVFVEPFITKWASRYSRIVVPYVIKRLDPIAPELIRNKTPKELEELIFDEIINAPGAPQWKGSKEEITSAKRNRDLRRIFNDVIKEYDITKAAAKVGKQD